jgi:hypothetical protein
MLYFELGENTSQQDIRLFTSSVHKENLDIKMSSKALTVLAYIESYTKANSGLRVEEFNDINSPFPFKAHLSSLVRKGFVKPGKGNTYICTGVGRAILVVADAAGFFK